MIEQINREFLEKVVEFSQEAINEAFAVIGLPPGIIVSIDEKDAYQFYEAADDYYQKRKAIEKD